MLVPLNESIFFHPQEGHLDTIATDLSTNRSKALLRKREVPMQPTTTTTPPTTTVENSNNNQSFSDSTSEERCYFAYLRKGGRFPYFSPPPMQRHGEEEQDNPDVLRTCDIIERREFGDQTGSDKEDASAFPLPTAVALLPLNERIIDKEPPRSHIKGSFSPSTIPLQRKNSKRMTLRKVFGIFRKAKKKPRR